MANILEKGIPTTSDRIKSDVDIGFKCKHTTTNNRFYWEKKRVMSAMEQSMVPSRAFVMIRLNKKRTGIQKSSPILSQAKGIYSTIPSETQCVTAESIRLLTFRFNLQYLHLYIGSHLNSVYRFTQISGMHCFFIQLLFNTRT
jgi:hypothetical protein